MSSDYEYYRLARERRFIVNAQTVYCIFLIILFKKNGGSEMWTNRINWYDGYIWTYLLLHISKEKSSLHKTLVYFTPPYPIDSHFQSNTIDSPAVYSPFQIHILSFYPTLIITLLHLAYRSWRLCLLLSGSPWYKLLEKTPTQPITILAILSLSQMPPRNPDTRVNAHSCNEALLYTRERNVMFGSWILRKPTHVMWITIYNSPQTLHRFRKMNIGVKFPETGLVV